MKARFITIGLLLVAVLALFMAGCQDAPVGTLENAKKALQAAAKAGARRYAAPKYKYAESLVQIGWMEIASQNGRLAVMRDYDKADSLLLYATELAHQAGKKATDSLDFLRTTAFQQRAKLLTDLAEWQGSVGGSLVQKRAAKYLSSARFAINTSEQLEKAGEYEDAIEELEKGEHALHRVGILVSNFAAEEANLIGTWRRLVRETVDQSSRENSYAVIVVKSDRKTYLLKDGKVIRSYDCDLGFNPSQQKTLSGDGATPEGKYYVSKYRPTGSMYYKALLLNYPNEEDKMRFKREKDKGMISKSARIGGLIEIHGDGGRNDDWTLGCVALTNPDMDHLMRHTNVGTPVTIVRKSDRWP
jgi:L,D-peptidoglycan transpeptidase YkuD (ErfK/YbiS/YcfS/YnhG family)